MGAVSPQPTSQASVSILTSSASRVVGNGTDTDPYVASLVPAGQNIVDDDDVDGIYDFFVVVQPGPNANDGAVVDDLS